MKRLILPLIILTLFTNCKNDFSSGYRTGYIEMIAKGGIYFVTWEGRMVMGNSEFAESDKEYFKFSLDSEAQHGEDITSLSDSLILAMQIGCRVTVHYNKHVFMDWNGSRGKSNYHVDKVVLHREY